MLCSSEADELRRASAVLGVPYEAAWASPLSPPREDGSPGAPSASAARRQPNRKQRGGEDARGEDALAFTPGGATPPGAAGEDAGGGARD